MPSEFGESATRNHEARQESHSFAAASSGFGAHASAAPAGFDSRPASSPAEDSLLDLDDIESAPATDSDDLILDFDNEPASFARHEPAAFEAAPAMETVPHVEEAATVEVSAAHAEEQPANISPANLSSAWQDFNPSALPADADAPTVPGIDSAAMDFETEEATQAVGHSDSEGATATFDMAAAPSDFEIVNPPMVEDRVEAARVEATEESSEPVAESAGFAAHEPAQTAGMELSPETIDAIARRVVEQMSERVLREIAWEVVPDLAERLIRQRLEEEKSRAQ